MKLFGVSLHQMAVSGVVCSSHWRNGSIREWLAWKEKYLSAAGKDVLIKYVAEALPIYIMSVFKLPSTLCDELMKQVRAFWWGGENGRTRMQWIPWEKLVMPKDAMDSISGRMQWIPCVLGWHYICVAWRHFESDWLAN